MKKINALVFTLQEFKEVCDKIFSGEAWIENESGNWFWVISPENFEDEEINKKLELEFGKEISGFKIEKLCVDLTEDAVVILYK